VLEAISNKTAEGKVQPSSVFSEMLVAPWQATSTFRVCLVPAAFKKHYILFVRLTSLNVSGILKKDYKIIKTDTS
jgi:hypothetical protein